ncbi:hypothetical protein L218DRAFT_946371 [Marasmius fiardii PR-910]|nr:hypothetical protein L218DRAFT_946371 [Marasmius fiardii PR-910]
MANGALSTVKANVDGIISTFRPLRLTAMINAFTLGWLHSPSLCSLEKMERGYKGPPYLRDLQAYRLLETYWLGMGGYRILGIERRCRTLRRSHRKCKGGSLSGLGVSVTISTKATYRGHLIPRDSTVIPNVGRWLLSLSAMTRDEEMYPDPYKFSLDRWIMDGKINPATSLVWVWKTAVDENGNVIEPEVEYERPFMIVDRFQHLAFSALRNSVSAVVTGARLKG